MLVRSEYRAVFFFIITLTKKLLHACTYNFTWFCLERVGYLNSHFRAGLSFPLRKLFDWVLQLTPCKACTQPLFLEKIVIPHKPECSRYLWLWKLGLLLGSVGSGAQFGMAHVCEILLTWGESGRNTLWCWNAYAATHFGVDGAAERMKGQFVRDSASGLAWWQPPLSVNLRPNSPPTLMSCCRRLLSKGHRAVDLPGRR